MKYSENACLLGKEYILLEVFDYGVRTVYGVRMGDAGDVRTHKVMLLCQRLRWK